MPAVCLYFQVHQPRRIKKYRVFDIGKDSNYFNDDSESDLNNRRILEKVANKCYLPTNRLMLELLEKHPEFKITYSISGIALEQMEEFYPEVLKSFQALTMTGRVEILSETYYHSLAFVRSKEEFRKQVSMHRDKVRRLFYQDPRVFRNTELIYNNDLAQELEKMGYEGVLAEGADHILDWRSPNFVYKPVGTERIKLFLKNYKLSDDIAFRFSSRDWSEYPLDASKFASWVSSVNGSGEVVNLFMDYETFGEHQWEDTGIFDFLRAMPSEILKHPDNSFVTPSEMVHKFSHVAELDVPHFVSWADVERDLSAWLSNPMQYDSLNKLYDLEAEVLKTMDKDIIEDWRKMQTSDHFYYMCTKWFADGDVHKYFNPYETPYDAFISFMNAFNDLKLRVRDKNKKWSII